jgi:hypothetical protein
MLTSNKTVGERPRARTIRSRIESEQARKRNYEASIAGTSKSPGGGPTYNSVTEPMPALSRPVITRS